MQHFKKCENKIKIKSSKKINLEKMQQASYIYNNFSKLKILHEIVEDLYLHEFWKNNKKAGKESVICNNFI